MNRRLPIFIVVFLVLCAAGLSYTYSIAPTFVATAKIQVDPGTSFDRAQGGAAFVANEAQALNSNEMFQSVLNALTEKRPALLRTFGSVAQLREVLAAIASTGANVIELQARGSEREQLAELLDMWAAAYLQSRGTRRTIDRDASIDEARGTVVSIEGRVTRKRRQLDEFRRRYNIVSPEREENPVAAEIRSLTGALNEARRKAIEAESRLSTARAGAADNKPVFRAQDKAAIAQLEQRALELRQQLKDLDLNFTPQYLAIDPRVKGMRANLQQIEQQIEATRRSSQQETLSEAAQDVLTLQENVARLEAQVGGRSKDALAFTSRFAELKTQTTELAQLEAELGQAKQRLALLERSERAREPQYELLGRAAVPEKPVYPDYVRYAGFSVGGALAAALLAVLLVDFLNPRPKRDPPAYPQPIIQIAYPTLAAGTGGGPLRLAGGMTALPAANHAPQAALAAPPRELTVPEVYALWDAATRDGRLAVAALFSGLTLAELATLTWDSVEVEAGCLKLPDATQGIRPLTAPLAQELQARAPGRTSTEPVAATRAGTALSISDLAGLVAAAAHDAGLEHAETIDDDTLRHTYVSFLVRQGARLSELEQAVGTVPPASFLQYRSLSPRGPGLPMPAIDRVFPAFRVT
ncbi:MAG: hypothetical protein WKH97_19135 [Casimicrobiaceae bacterium]